MAAASRGTYLYPIDYGYELFPRDMGLCLRENGLLGILFDVSWFQTRKRLGPQQAAEGCSLVLLPCLPFCLASEWFSTVQ